MEIIREISGIRKIIKTARENGQSVGFVPTMGFLHEGHLSLLRRARKENDLVVLSIFVNPLQFGVNEDFGEYPRDLERDAALSEENGCDIIFSPMAKEMYPHGYATYVDVQRLTEGLCGASRPGHFRGVTTVVTKLFNIVTPDRAYFGQKDAQQAMVIKRMTEDLNMDLEIIVLRTVRETDGLAMSSRNANLTTAERSSAPVLFQCLKQAEEQISSGERNPSTIIDRITKTIENEPLTKIDYVSIVDSTELKEVTIIKDRVLIALAVRFGKTRLIDNIIVEVEKCSVSCANQKSTAPQSPMQTSTTKAV
ncbi:MAG: pantoate--beta-alanine ligase [Dethiobacter sp.]|jgi:pantoate--beta-alanine ligase|nr:pantoate--beta-alanine ligase [Dethiobacter sp.]